MSEEGRLEESLQKFFSQINEGVMVECCGGRGQQGSGLWGNLSKSFQDSPAALIEIGSVVRRLNGEVLMANSSSLGGYCQV